MAVPYSLGNPWTKREGKRERIRGRKRRRRKTEDEEEETAVGEKNYMTVAYINLKLGDLVSTSSVKASIG